MEQFERYFQLKNGGRLNYTPLFDIKAAIDVIVIKITAWIQEQKAQIHNWINTTTFMLNHQLEEIALRCTC